MSEAAESLDRAAERRAFTLIGFLSVAVLAFLFWLLYFREGSAGAPSWVGSLPAVNALLNFTSAVFLVLGFLAIRAGKRELHMRLMLAALSVSALFLVSYVVYHHFQGDTRFLGQGLVRPIYFVILVSHILLSMVAVPLVLTTVFFAATRRFSRHRRIARFTFPVWLYVSVTGVAVFVLLRVWG